MRLRKVCPQCSTVIHARRSVCECGHAFTLKKEARITASSPAKRKRALESLEDTLRRQESNRTRMASMRASETLHVKLHKRRKNKEAMANARTRTVLIESAIAAFHSEVKLGPEFVCTCCHPMMYRKSVCWNAEGLHFSAFHYCCECSKTSISINKYMQNKCALVDNSKYSV